jgi:hypothetical protein
MRYRRIADVALGSFTPVRPGKWLCDMSAVLSIATEFVRCSTDAKCRTSGY